MCHWGKIYDPNPLDRDESACLALKSLGSTGMEGCSEETPRISNARGHPARGSGGREGFGGVLGESFGRSPVFPSP